MKKKILMSLFTIALVGALIGGGVMAVFTDQDISNPNTFSSGTLILTMPNPGGSWSTGFGNMKPGQTVTFTLAVRSDGTLPLKYTVTTAIGGALSTGATPCFVSAVRTDRAADGSPTPGSQLTLSAATGNDRIDWIAVDVKMPGACGNNYQGLSGTLTVTVNATQQ